MDDCKFMGLAGLSVMICDTTKITRLLFSPSVRMWAKSTKQSAVFDNDNSWLRQSLNQHLFRAFLSSWSGAFQQRLPIKQKCAPRFAIELSATDKEGREASSICVGISFCIRMKSSHLSRSLFQEATKVLGFLMYFLVAQRDGKHHTKRCSAGGYGNPMRSFSVKKNMNSWIVIIFVNSILHGDCFCLSSTHTHTHTTTIIIGSFQLSLIFIVLMTKNHKRALGLLVVFWFSQWIGKRSFGLFQQFSACMYYSPLWWC